MAIRCLVCACLFGAASSTEVLSVEMFKTRYTTYASALEGAAVKTANANIVGSAIPTNGDEVDMNKWYNLVGTTEQAEANTIMDKAYAAKPAAGGFPTASCLTDIAAAWSATDTWVEQYPIYSKIMADTEVTGATPQDVKDKKAWVCLNALSKEQKELAVQAGLRAKLFGLFKKKAVLCLPANADLKALSTCVTATLGHSAPAPNAGDAKGEHTQPMYFQADEALKREMMQYMVNKLSLKAQPLA